MRDWLEAVWYRSSPPPLWLRPLSALYGQLSSARALRHRAQAIRLPVPVVVVGNVSVGGTGKTPCTVWLAERLRALGYRPGIVSRGYGGSGPFPHLVRPGDDVKRYGDEPVLLAERTGLPVCVAPDRVEAGRHLLHAHPAVDLLLCDDGLQHYRLARDIEICVVDGTRGLGNGWLLPAGPLREPSERVRQVDLVMVNGGFASVDAPTALHFALITRTAVNLCSGESCPLSAFAGETVDALAGIGHPARFFQALRQHGLQVQERPFPDHHAYTPKDLAFDRNKPLLMTEKDAVKCRAFAAPHWWVVPAEFQLAAEDEAQVVHLLRERLQPMVARRREAGAIQSKETRG